MKKALIKSPYRLTFNNALLAAEYLVKQEHRPSKPCKSCQKTLRLLRELKKRLNNQAIGSNLVWPAFKYTDK